MLTKNHAPRFFFAAAVVALMSSTASFAQNAEFKSFRDGVIDGLAGIQVDSSALNTLPMAQVAELSIILGSGESNADQKAAAERVFEEVNDPADTSMESEGGKQLTSELKVAMAGSGLEFPDEPLTYNQTRQLLRAFDLGGADMIGRATAILGQFKNPNQMSNSSEGAMQVQSDLVQHFVSLRMEEPNWNTLTFAQTAELATIFDSSSTNDEKKDQAKAVLATN